MGDIDSKHNEIGAYEHCIGWSVAKVSYWHGALKEKGKSWGSDEENLPPMIHSSRCWVFSKNKRVRWKDITGCVNMCLLVNAIVYRQESFSFCFKTFQTFWKCLLTFHNGLSFGWGCPLDATHLKGCIPSLFKQPYFGFKNIHTISPFKLLLFLLDFSYFLGNSITYLLSAILR